MIRWGPGIGCALAFSGCLAQVNAQSTYQPYSYQFYQKLNNVLYHTDNRLHTALKPMLIDSALQSRYDSLMGMGVRERQSWWGRKLYNEHLIDIRNDEYTFYADFLPDFQIGRDFAGGGRTTWLNTRGAQAGVTIEDKFSLYVNFFENQGVFPDYVDDYVFTHAIMPGQGYGKTMTDNPQKKDWMYGSAVASYTVNKYLNVALAYDKNFIGDGYRSVLLSDISSNYTALKLTGKLGNVQYMSMWTYMLDPMHPRSHDTDLITGLPSRVGDSWKWGAFQYLDWNVSNRFSAGLFQSVVWGAGYAYIPGNSSSPAWQWGLNTKYKLLDNLTVYGQFLLEDVEWGEWAAQLGFRGFDAFGIKDLNFLAEYNTARPYTYAHFDPVSNYSNYGQPLAHPWGANFRELVGILNYSYRRFDFSAQATWGQFGTDPNQRLNFGGDIFKPSNIRYRLQGNRIGQGVQNNLLYMDGRIAYLFNPTYNLRVEAGWSYRQREAGRGLLERAGMLTLGLRGSFRNFYYDF